jgi:uncharacterized protein (TIGR00255 family)
MLKSMTGFGSDTILDDLGQITIDLNSTNRKYFEVNCSLPKELIFLETQIRKFISKKISRGHVLVHVNILPNFENPNIQKTKIDLYKKLLKYWLTIAEDLNLEKGSINIEFLSKQISQYNFPSQETNELKTPILKCLEKALIKLLEMKKLEGKELENDIKKRLDIIKNSIGIIDNNKKDASEKFQKKLTTKLEEYNCKDHENEDKILKEIAIFAEKVDITEELLRISSHLKQFFSLFDSEIPQGRKLDFLIQEFMREINTIGSKSSNIEISKQVVEIKAELEKIREQVQNIE